MKKIINITSLILFLVLVLAACRKGVEDNSMPEVGEIKEEESLSSEKDMMNNKDDMDDEKLIVNEGTMANKDDTNEEKMPAEEDTVINKDDMDEEKLSAEEGTMDNKDDMDKENTMGKDEMDDSALMNEGEMAPDFSFMTLEGGTVSLEDFKGEKLYVKFWASWCPICIGGLEEIDTLSAEAEGFKVITVVTPNFRGEKSEEEFKAWYDPMKTPNLTVLLDNEGAFAREFGVRAYPTSAYIGSDSTLIKVAPGHIDNEVIVETIGTFN